MTRFDPRVLPTILIFIDLLAAAGYLFHGGISEWRKVMYWVAAAVLTFTVTW